MDKNCSGCAHQHDCKSIYEAIGNQEGPGVAWKVVTAFLLPIAVFIGSVGGLQVLLQDVISSEKLRTLAVFVGSTTVVMLVVAVLSLVERGKSRFRTICQNKEFANGSKQ